MLKHLEGHIEFLWTDKDDVVLAYYDEDGDLEYECVIPEKTAYQLYLILDENFKDAKRVVKYTLKTED